MDTSLNGIYQNIADIGRRLGADRVMLYGSRARGDHKDRSDIDIAVYDMPVQNRAAFWLELEELPTLLKFDIAHIPPCKDPEFLRNIERDGVTLYEKGR